MPSRRRKLLIPLFIIPILTFPSISALMSSQLGLVTNGIQYANAQQSDEFLAYVNSDYGVSIDYPHDWYKEEYPGNYLVTFYSPYESDEDQYAEYVGIFAESVNSMTLNSYVETYIEELEEDFPELEVLDQISTTISDTAAVKLVTADTDFDEDGNLDHKSVRVFVVKDGRAFVIIYDAVQGKYESYLPIVNQMLESLKINTSNLPAPATGDRLLTYQNSTHGLQLEYPDNWEITYYDAASYHFTYFYPPYESDFDSVAEFIGVGYEQVPPGTSLGEYTEVSIDSFSNGDAYFEMVESRSTTLSGLLAHKIVFTSYAFDYGETKSMAIWTVKGDRAFTILFQSEKAAYEQYILLVEELLDSFMITYKESDAGESKPNVELETKEFLPYNNPRQAFTITYPDNWEKVEPSSEETLLTGEIVTFGSPLEDAFVSVTIESLYWKPMALDEYTELTMDSLKKEISLLNVEESKGVSISGEPGKRVVYSGLFTFFGDTLVDVKVMQVWTVIQESRAYVFTYITLPENFDDYLPIAEQMLSSFEIDMREVPKKVEGKYDDEELGLSIELPDGWIGAVGNSEVKEQLPFDTAVMIFPEFAETVESTANMSLDEIDSNQYMNDLLSSFVIIASVKTEDMLHGKLNYQKDPDNESKCETSPSAKIVKTASGLKALKMSGECSYSKLDNDYELVAYVVFTNKNTIFLAFFGTADSREKLVEFENSLQTIEVKAAIDLSDPAALVSAFGEEKRQVTRHMVAVDDNPYEVVVLSNSTISELTLESEKKQISFKVEGEEGTQGSIELEVGQVLKGPYTVTVDGTVLDETFTIEDETTGKTIVTFSYPHSVHDITITGTAVIPEFGAVATIALALGIMTVMMGYLVTQKRLKPTH